MTTATTATEIYIFKYIKTWSMKKSVRENSEVLRKERKDNYLLNFKCLNLNNLGCVRDKVFGNGLLCLSLES